MTSSMDLDTEAYRLAFAAALRRHVGFGRQWSVADFSDKTGIPIPSLKQYMLASQVAPYDRVCRMLDILPTTFADDILHPAGLGGVHRLTNEEPNVFRFLKWCSKAVKHFMSAMADGKLSDQEKRAAVPIMQKIGGMALGFSKRWGRV